MKKDGTSFEILMGSVEMKNVFEMVMSLSEVHRDFILKYAVSEDLGFHIWKQLIY